MRKFTKILLIGALIAAIVGILCIVGSFATGGFQILRDQTNLIYGQKTLGKLLYGRNHDASEKEGTMKTDRQSGEATDSYLSKNQTVNFVIDAEAADVTFEIVSGVAKDGENGTALVKIQYDKDVQSFDMTEEDGVLTVTETTDKNSTKLQKILENFDGADVTIQLAEGTQIGSLQITSGVGDVTGNRELNCDSVSISLGVGDVTFKKMNCMQNAQFKTGVGDLSVKGYLHKDITFESGTGDLIVETIDNGKNDGVSYDLSTRVGEVTINDINVGGSAPSAAYQFLSQGAAQTISMKTGVGDISVGMHLERIQ